MSIDRMALARHARRSAPISLTILAIDIAIYVLMVAGTVMAEAMWLQALPVSFAVVDVMKRGRTKGGRGER
jgi:hypothetical protein